MCVYSEEDLYYILMKRFWCEEDSHNFVWLPLVGTVKCRLQDRQTDREKGRLGHRDGTETLGEAMPEFSGSQTYYSPIPLQTFDHLLRTPSNS